MKSDGEPAIRKVRDATSVLFGGRVPIEEPTPDESQSNGHVEQAGKSVRGMIKTLMAKEQEAGRSNARRSPSENKSTTEAVKFLENCPRHGEQAFGWDTKD